MALRCESILGFHTMGDTMISVRKSGNQISLQFDPSSCLDFLRDIDLSSNVSGEDKAFEIGPGGEDYPPQLAS